MVDSSITVRIKAIAEQVAGVRGVELVHAEVAGTKRDSVVRIYIDKPDGITLDDCGGFSTAFEEILDAEDFILGKYVLEVSSPGIERELYSLADFVKFTGHLAKVKTKVEINGQKTFSGIMNAIDGDGITIEDKAAGLVIFPYSNVAKANLKIDLGQELKKRL